MSPCSPQTVQNGAGSNGVWQKGQEPESSSLCSPQELQTPKKLRKWVTLGGRLGGDGGEDFEGGGTMTGSTDAQRGEGEAAELDKCDDDASDGDAGRVAEIVGEASGCTIGVVTEEVGAGEGMTVRGGAAVRTIRGVAGFLERALILFLAALRGAADNLALASLAAVQQT